jgi:hypothetical protein
MCPHTRKISLTTKTSSCSAYKTSCSVCDTTVTLERSGQGGKKNIKSGSCFFGSVTSVKFLSVVWCSIRVNFEVGKVEILSSLMGFITIGREQVVYTRWSQKLTHCHVPTLGPDEMEKVYTSCLYNSGARENIPRDLSTKNQTSSFLGGTDWFD